MYERQAYERDGRWTFWGGLAVGVVDGGRGLVDQQAAAAARFGIEVRHEAPVAALVPGGVRRAAPDGGLESCAPGRSCWPRAASSPIRRCARATWGRTGTSPRCAGRRTTPARCCSPRWSWAPRRTGTGAAATRSSGTAGAPPTGDLELTNRFSRQSYPVGIVVNARRRAVHRRGRGLPQLHLRQVRRGGAAPARRRRVPGLRSAVVPAAARDRLRGAGRDAGRGGRRCGSWGRRCGSTPSASNGPSRDFNAAIVGGPFDPGGQGRAAHGRARRAQVQLGAGRWTRRRSSRSRSRAGSRSRSAGCAWTRTRGCWTSSGRPIPGLFACGELVGGLFFHNYPGGSGLTAGTVYGRRAGYAATA